MEWKQKVIRTVKAEALNIKKKKLNNCGQLFPTGNNFIGVTVTVGTALIEQYQQVLLPSRTDNNLEQQWVVYSDNKSCYYHTVCFKNSVTAC